MRRTLILAGMVVMAAGAMAGAQTRPAGTQPATTRGDDAATMARLQRQVADLKKENEALRAENEKLKKQWNDAVRNGTGGTSTSTSKPTTTRAAAGNDQDGPGLYRVSAGPGGKYSATVRAKSREDAISIGLKTVAQRAMDFDENVEIGTLKVEKVGP